jgi:hypothetical protein
MVADTSWPFIVRTRTERADFFATSLDVPMLDCAGVCVGVTRAAQQRQRYGDDDAGTRAGTRAAAKKPVEHSALPRVMEPLNDARDGARRHERHHGIYFAHPSLNRPTGTRDEARAR